MAQVTISITRSKVYAVAEGISVTISRHSGGTPTYEQLWASPSEAPKLDIYYREAVGDLERRLMDWASATSSQFDLEADGTDYTLTLDMSPHWPSRLEGLLDNKIQDFLVHAVTAGWLNDFDGLTVKQDYQAMSAQDLLDILAIVWQREFSFAESVRGTDSTEKDNPDAVTAGERAADSTEKGRSTIPTHALARKKDDIVKHDNDRRPKLCIPQNLRHRDNAVVDTCADWTDWGGTGMPYRDRMPPSPHPQRLTRPMIGTGFTPSNVPPPPPPMNHNPYDRMSYDRTPENPEDRPTERRRGGFAPGPVPPDHRDPRIPDDPTHPNYPDYYPNGRDWSDKQLYDAEGSERDMHRHVCGRHDCNMTGDDPLDWDLND